MLFFVDLGCTFEYIQYRRTESSSFTIRLVVSRVPASTFSVILYEEDDTAEGKCIACTYICVHSDHLMNILVVHQNVLLSHANLL